MLDTITNGAPSGMFARQTSKFLSLNDISEAWKQECYTRKWFPSYYGSKGSLRGQFYFTRPCHKDVYAPTDLSSVAVTCFTAALWVFNKRGERWGGKDFVSNSEGV